MTREQPATPEAWLDEITLSIADARKTKPIGWLTGQRTTDANLFHLAPLVCLKFRGLDYRELSRPACLVGGGQPIEIRARLRCFRGPAICETCCEGGQG